jgi:predicted DCC family thiol-disulfide oxidoreductase YuxK
MELDQKGSPPSESSTRNITNDEKQKENCAADQFFSSLLDTFYIVANYRSESPALLSKTRAAFFVMEILDCDGALRALRMFPNALLDLGYDLIAFNRYRMFGQSESCLMPSAEFMKRFIDI